MDQSSFQKLLLKHALHVTVCDGDLDKREVEAFREMTRTTPYFAEIDCDVELRNVLAELEARGPVAIDESLVALGSVDLSERARLKLLDVLVHLVHADHRVTAAEQHYLRRMSSVLGVTATTLAQQFPTRFALFLPGASESFGGAPAFALPASIDAGSLLDGGS